jgi:hypothetical protein
VTTYELRTGSGRPFMAFDSKTRAQEYRAAHLKRTKVALRLFEVRRVEQELAA